MGNALGLFTDDEIQNLSDEQKKQLTMDIVAVLKRTGIFKNFLDNDENAKRVLRDAVQLPR